MSVLRSGLRGRLVKRIEFCYTPKHGNWLNIAENELRIRQCLRNRRLGDIEALQAETWSVDVNEEQRGVDWQMKVDDARCKFKKSPISPLKRRSPVTIENQWLVDFAA